MGMCVTRQRYVPCRLCVIHDDDDCDDGNHYHYPSRDPHQWLRVIYDCFMWARCKLFKLKYLSWISFYRWHPMRTVLFNINQPKMFISYIFRFKPFSLPIFVYKPESNYIMQCMKRLPEHFRIICILLTNNNGSLSVLAMHIYGLRGYVSTFLGREGTWLITPALSPHRSTPLENNNKINI